MRGTLIVQTSFLHLFSCKNLWKPKSAGLWQITLPSIEPYIEKYNLTLLPVSGQSFTQIVYEGEVIGICQGES